MFYPPFASIIKQDLKDLLYVKQSLFSMLSLVTLFILCSILVLFANLYITVPASLPVIRHLSPRWLALLPLAVLLELLRRYYDDLYVFEANQITRQQGRLSLELFVPCIRYEDIKGISVYQTFWGRVFQYGDVLLGTAANANYEIVIENVPYPQELSELIEEFKSYNQERSHTDEKTHD